MIQIAIDAPLYFQLLQDPGEEMSPEQKAKFASPKTSSRSRKTRKIVYLDKLYPQLYTLAGLFMI